MLSLQELKLGGNGAGEAMNLWQQQQQPSPVCKVSPGWQQSSDLLCIVFARIAGQQRGNKAASCCTC
jgi:hypothetical protein